MAIIRQMSELYLRGSLANVTMKNLTEREIQFCQQLTERVANHECMKKHRYQVVRVLGETIGADYREDRFAAEQEYKIAIWRAVVNLFFHRHYKFTCMSCGSSQRIVKTTGISKPFDQLYMPCPVCNKIKITQPGCTGYTIGQYVEHEEFQDSYVGLTSDLPSCESSIVASVGDYYDLQQLDQLLSDGQINERVYERRTQQFRYDDPEVIIEDEIQMAKFFGEFVWGYFKQQLRENTRTEHKKKPVRFYGRADEVVVEDLKSLATRLKIRFIYCTATQPEEGWFKVQISGLHSSPEFTFELLPIIQKAYDHGVVLKVEHNSIKVKQDLDAPFLETFIIKPEHVVMTESDDRPSNAEDGKAFSIDSVSHKTSYGENMDTLDHTQVLESQDVLDTIYQSLPAGHCQKIFKLYQQYGDVYEDFRQQFEGDGEPKQAHIARYLGITPRMVKHHIRVIKHMCLAHGATP
jgi:hypothetical protein